jgi:hypothetical protein
MPIYIANVLIPKFFPNQKLGEKTDFREYRGYVCGWE